MLRSRTMRKPPGRMRTGHLRSLVVALLAVAALINMPLGGSGEALGRHRLQHAGVELAVMPDGTIRRVADRLDRAHLWQPCHLRQDNAPTLTGLSRFMLTIARGF